MKPPAIPDPARRRFLYQAPCAALSSISVLSTLLNLRLAGSLAAEDVDGNDCKALVCVFLHGGNDSWNVLVPRGSEYAAYANARSNLALAEDSLHNLEPPPPPVDDGRLYGLHPALGEIAAMYNGTGAFAGKRRAAFVTNVGTLIQPTTLPQYHAGSVPLPKALFSHSDQIEQWQTSVPQGLAQLTGWAGRAADVLHSMNSGQVSMSISLGGNNVFQVGAQTGQFVITPQGALGFVGGSDPNDPRNLLNIKNRTVKSLVEQTYRNTMDQAFATLTKNSVTAQEQFGQVFSSTVLPPAVEALFPAGNYLATTLRAVLRTIVARQALGLRRQTFFTGIGGWDMHGDLLGPHTGLLTTVSRALHAFQQGIEMLGLHNDVVTFTASDFGRTLRSNGRGTDHAWSGNALVIGGPVQGGRIYGTYPVFDQIGADLFGPLDVGYGGRLLPTTSADVYFAELLRWFGVPAGSMSYALPNIGNFWNPTGPAPLGFLP